MVGFYATASESQEIRTDLDNELTGKWNRASRSHHVHLLIALPSDAKWFTRDEILAVINHPQGTNFDFTVNPQSGKNEPPFRIPPKTAIAGVLISDWVHGKALDDHCASPRL